jgi:hypothetical protein
MKLKRVLNYIFIVACAWVLVASADTSPVKLDGRSKSTVTIQTTGAGAASSVAEGATVTNAVIIGGLHWIVGSVTNTIIYESGSFVFRSSDLNGTTNLNLPWR